MISVNLLAHGPAYCEDHGNLVIEDIDVRGLRSIKEEELLYMMDLAPGAPLDEDRVTEGIKRSFMKGIFNSLSVTSQGNSVTVNVSEKPLIGRISTDSAIIPRKELLEIIGIARGDHVTGNLIERRVEALREHIRIKGYHKCDIKYSLNPLEPDNLMELELEIDEGPPTVIKEIVVFGRPAGEVTKRLHLRPGDVFDTHVLEQDLEDLKEHYSEMGFISPSIGPVEFVDGKLVLRIRTGRRLDFQIKAIKGGRFFLVFPVRAIPDKTIIETMPFLDEGEINDDLLAEGVERVIELYRSKGYSDVQVAPIVKADNGDVEIRLYINEGSKKEVRSFNVTKNGERARERVGAILNNREGREFRPFKLEDDAKLIREFYSALGYRDAVVSEPKVKPDGNFVDISVDVNIGEWFPVRDIVLTGNKEVADAFIKGKIGITAGAPFYEPDIIKARREVQAACRGLGLYHCVVDTSYEFGPEGVLVKFQINEGERFVFGKTIVSGNRLIDTETIKRHLKFSEGEPLDPEKLVQARQRLLGLGVFTRVDTEIVWSGDKAADIHVDVSESSPGKVDFGIGYGEYEGFRTFVDIGYRNLFGDADIASVRLEASSLWRRYILNYTEPYFLGRDLTSRTFILREEKDQKNIDTGETSYRVIKNTASTGLERSLGKHVSASLFYEYSIVDTYDVKPGIVLSKEDLGTVAISSLSPAIYYSTLDDPFDPASGVLVGFTVKDAADYLFSDAEFSKFTLKASSYKRLGRDVVGAISLGGGTAETRGETESIPLVERFYLGGRNSVRGFKQDSLGPKDAFGEPIGGRFYLLGNLEFRVSLFGSWRTVLFGDCGNVWLERDQVSTSDLRCSAGTGLRYKTPVGPLRLDYGWKINRLESESPGEFHFSIGHVF